MKSIGIKLADGSFYPILEEGSNETKDLEVTTVKDNQTKVQIDLYRSETNSMDDAEYVDSLEITHLKPHPNGEPTFSLELNLAAKLCNLLRKCKDRKFINDIKCFDLRLLFVLSLLHTDIRSQLRYELQGLPLLTQILESVFSIKWTDEYESAIDHNGPPLSPQETDCAIEALKALFNVTVDSWKVHKEVRSGRVFSSAWNFIDLGAA